MKNKILVVIGQTKHVFVISFIAVSERSWQYKSIGVVIIGFVVVVGLTAFVERRAGRVCARAWSGKIAHASVSRDGCAREREPESRSSRGRVGEQRFGQVVAGQMEVDGERESRELEHDDSHVVAQY